MLSNSLNRLNRTNRLITVEDISDNLLSGRSAAHTACWKYLQTNSNDSALEYADEIIRKEPDSPDGYVFKARALYQKKRFLDAEQVLLQVMHIAEDNDMIRSDVEAFVKLKYELASVRKEILRALDVVNVKDVVKRYLDNFKASIIELYSFSSPLESQSADKDKEVYRDSDSDPTLEVEDCDSSVEYNSCRSPLYNDEDLDQELSQAINGCDFDERVVTISRSEYLRLKESDRKSLEYEQKIQDLEEELKKVYVNTIEMTKAKKAADKEVAALKSELEHMANMVKYVEDKEDQRENRYFYGNQTPYMTKKSKQASGVPNMIAIHHGDIRADAPTPTQVTSNSETTLRTIFHDNRFVPKVEPN